MHSLFLTNNPNLGSTARILQSWLAQGRSGRHFGALVVQRPGDLADWLAREQVPHTIDPMPWPDRRRPVRTLWHPWKVARWARRQGCAVIHCNEHDVYPFATTLRRFLDRPTVCHVRFRIDRGFAEWAFGPGRTPEALLWTSHQQKADSAAAVDGLVPDDRQHVVRLGLDLNTFGTLAAGRAETRRAWGIEPDEIVIATASPLRPRKKVEDFIDLVVRLARRHPKVVGILAGGAIAGDEAYSERMQQTVRESGLGRRLQTVGNLEPVEPLYHAADIVVSTSEYETFGNSVCEAMACRRPVVGYCGGSVHEVVGDTGRIVETGNLDALTAVTDELIGDEQRRRVLGERARERVATEFNPANSFEQLQQIYSQILAKDLTAKTPQAV